jgi:redox-sensitive bicupin YhaK (pirin superfamily)
MIELVIDARRKDLGGFEVGRILPFAKHRMVGPFAFLDHMGPAHFTPGAEGLNVRPHPHIGLSTVTYLFEGRIRHLDNLGSDQPVLPAEVNWMTAGRGIVHSERTEDNVRAAGVTMHGMQAWVALPVENEDDAPSFAHHGQDDLPSYSHAGLSARLIAGSAFGVTAKVKTHSPLFYVHWELDAGVTGGVPADHPERAVYVARGSVEIDHITLNAGQMAVLKSGGAVPVMALEPSTVMLMGGESVGPRILWWNFVASSQDRIDAAKADWKAGRMTLPPDDNSEFIPLPDDPPPPPPRMP